MVKKLPESSQKRPLLNMVRRNHVRNGIVEIIRRRVKNVRSIYKATPNTRKPVSQKKFCHFAKCWMWGPLCSSRKIALKKEINVKRNISSTTQKASLCSTRKKSGYTSNGSKDMCTFDYASIRLNATIIALINWVSTSHFLVLYQTC